MSKVGDFIYPQENGTNGFFKKPEWHLVLEVSNEGTPTHIRIFYCYKTVSIIKSIMDLKEKGFFDKGDEK